MIASRVSGCENCSLEADYGMNKMPLAIKVALAWLVLLATGAVVMACGNVWEVATRNLGVHESVFRLLFVAVALGLCVTFPIAVYLGRRNWMEIPYAIFGYVSLLPMIVKCRHPLSNSFAVTYMAAVVVFALFPLILLRLPWSSEWFAAKERYGGFNPSYALMFALLTLIVVYKIFPAD